LASLAAARAPPAATPPPHRRAWLRIFGVRCGLPCDPRLGVIHAIEGRYHALAKERTMLLRCESRLQPRDGRMAHTIATRDIHQRLARLAPCQSLLPLMRRELVRAAKAHAALFGTLAAFTRPGADQLALKLGQAAENREHQPAVRRSCIRPSVGQRAEPRASLGDGVEDVQQIPRRARQPIKSGDDEHVAGFEPLEKLAERGAIRLGTTNLLR